jgi:hypothetical protein
MDIYPHPVNFEQALKTRVVKAILPTDMDSAMLRTLPTAIRERAMFSAGVQNTDFLTRAADAVDKIVSGTSDRATERMQLRQLADSLGMDELAKDPRLNLILDTQTGMARGYGSFIEGQHPAVLDMWPAQEFYRAEERKEPRDWPARWAEAGGQFFPGDADYSEGRMVALKDDDIWTDISAFGQPYPPFDFNSGMSVRDIDHDEAVELGLITDDYMPDPQKRGFNTGLQASIGLAADFGLGVELGHLLAGIAKVGEDGIVRFLTK